LLAKNSFLLVFFLCVFNIFVDHGSRWGTTVQALAQWRHPVASSEARDVLHWAMRPASYHRIRMVIKITSTFPSFSAIVDSVVANNLR
jgi:hypothetical protein